MSIDRQEANGLQLDEDRDWQESFWSFQRFCWIVMALVVLAAIAGLTGKGGPLASAKLQTTAGSVDYPRITRWQSDENVILHLPRSTPEKVDVLLSPAFADVFGIDSIVPEPVSSTTTAQGHRFTFAVGPGQGEKQIVFNVTAGRPVIGQDVALRIGDAPGRITVTVLP